MSDLKQCPNCGQINAVEAKDTDSKERSICQSCGWRGPKCYGKSWEAHHPICAGGNDPNFWDADRKTHKRPQCGLYQICASEMNRLKVNGLTPITSLIRQQHPAQVTPQMSVPQPPPQVVLPMVDGTKRVVSAQPPTMMPTMPPLPTPPKSIQVKPLMPQVPQQMIPTPAQPQAQHWQQPGQPVMVMMVPPEQAGMPALVPQNLVQPGTQVMSVICVPEQGELPYHKRFFGSVGRAMLKHGFMQAANMMDHVPWWK